MCEKQTRLGVVNGRQNVWAQIQRGWCDSTTQLTHRLLCQHGKAAFPERSSKVDIVRASGRRVLQPQTDTAQGSWARGHRSCTRQAPRSRLPQATSRGRPEPAQKSATSFRYSTKQHPTSYCSSQAESSSPRGINIPKPESMHFYYFLSLDTMLQQ